MVRRILLLSLIMVSYSASAEDSVKGETELERLYHDLKYEESERQRRFGQNTVNGLLNKNNAKENKQPDLLEKKAINKSQQLTESSSKSESNSSEQTNKDTNKQTKRASLTDEYKKQKLDTAATNESVTTETKKQITKHNKADVRKDAAKHKVAPERISQSTSTAVKRHSVVNNHYMPPSTYVNNISAGSGGVTQSYSNKNYNKYGIRRNTWVKARLIRKVTSADSTYIEVELEEDVVGTRKVLPAGTVLFGNKSFNSQTRRLESQFIDAIDTEGNDIKPLSATLFDMNKVAGLTGLVTRDNEDSVNYSVYAGLASASNTVLQGLGGDNAAAEGVVTGGKTMLDMQKGKVKKPKAFITVSPRQVLIRFDKSL